MTGCCFQRLAIESISIHCSISFQNSSRAPQTIDFHIPSRPRHLRQRCVSPVFTWPLSWLLFTRSALQPQRLRTSARPYPRPRRLLQRLLCFVQRKRRAFVLARRAVGTIWERREGVFCHGSQDVSREHPKLKPSPPNRSFLGVTTKQYNRGIIAGVDASLSRTQGYLLVVSYTHRLTP